MIAPSLPTTTPATVTVAQQGTKHTQIFTMSGSDTLEALRVGVAGLIDQVARAGGSPTGATCVYGADASGSVTLTVTWNTVP